MAQYTKVATQSDAAQAIPAPKVFCFFPFDVPWYLREGTRWFVYVQNLPNEFGVKHTAAGHATA